MNLGEFHTVVSSEVKRGTSLDAVIPLRVSMAVAMLERNLTMQYMRLFIEIVLIPSDTSPRLVQLPSDIKSVRFLRITDSFGLYKELKKFDLKDQMKLTTGRPEGYTFNGRSMIMLDKTPDSAYTIEGEIKFFTAWPTDLTATPWLVTSAPDLLLAQTMVLIGNYLRDVQIVAQYRGWRDECLKTLVSSETEFEYDAMDTEMAYSPKYGIPDSVADDS